MRLTTKDLLRKYKVYSGIIKVVASAECKRCKSTITEICVQCGECDWCHGTAMREEYGAAVRDNTHEELISMGLEACLDFETGGES